MVRDFLSRLECECDMDYQPHEDESDLRCECIQYSKCANVHVLCYYNLTPLYIVSQKRRWPLHQQLHQHHLLGGEEAEAEAEAGGEPRKEGEVGGEEERIEGHHHHHRMGDSKYRLFPSCTLYM